MKSIELLILIVLSTLFITSSFKGISCGDTSEYESFLSEEQSDSIGTYTSKAFHHAGEAMRPAITGARTTVTRIGREAAETISSLSQRVSEKFTSLTRKVQTSVQLQERIRNAKSTVSERYTEAVRSLKRAMTELQKEVSDFLKSTEMRLIENSKPDDAEKLESRLKEVRSWKRSIQAKLPDNQATRALVAEFANIEGAIENRLLAFASDVVEVKSSLGLGIHTASCVYPAIVSIISILVLYPGENLFWLFLNFHVLQYILNQFIGLCYESAKNVLIYFDIAAYLCLLWILRSDYMKAFTVLFLVGSMYLYIWSTATFVGRQ